MTSPFQDRRLRQLLDSADATMETLQNPLANSQGSSDVMGQLDALHRDMGRRLHDLWLSSRGDIGELDDVDALQEITDLEDVDALEAIDPIDPEPAPGVWVEVLQDTLALLHAPTNDADAVALAHEASRIQWATVGLHDRWGKFPQPIQVALLGLLGARCRRLCNLLAIDVGAKAALSRLADYRLQAGLATVVALVPDREPESGDWTQDALHWWDMLTAGIEA